MVDADGEPVYSATVELVQTTWDRRVGWASSDEDGGFEMPSAPDGPLELRVTYEGDVNGDAPMHGQRSDLVAGAKDVVVTIRPGRAIVVRLFDAHDRKPLAVHRLRIVCLGVDPPGFTSANAMAGGGLTGGHVRLRPGEYDVAIYPAGYVPLVQRHVVVRDEDVTALDLFVTPLE